MFFYFSNNGIHATLGVTVGGAGGVLLEGEERSLGVVWSPLLLSHDGLVRLGQPRERSLALPFIPDSMWLEFLTDGREWGTGFLYLGLLLRQSSRVKRRVGSWFLVQKFRMNPVLPDQWAPRWGRRSLQVVPGEAFLSLDHPASTYTLTWTMQTLLWGRRNLADDSQWKEGARSPMWVWS